MKGNGVFETVRGVDRKDGPLAETMFRKSGCGALNCVSQLPVAELATGHAVDKGGFVREASRMAQYEGRHRGIRKQDIGIGAVKDHSGPPSMAPHSIRRPGRCREWGLTPPSSPAPLAPASSDLRIFQVTRYVEDT